jgi:hypothetical protein
MNDTYTNPLDSCLMRSNSTFCETVIRSRCALRSGRVAAERSGSSASLMGERTAMRILVAALALAAVAQLFNVAPANFAY